MHVRLSVALGAILLLFAFRAGGQTAPPDTLKFLELFRTLGIASVPASQQADSVVTFIEALRRVIATNPPPM